MKKLTPLHYCLLIAALTVSNIVFFCANLKLFCANVEIAKERDQLNIFMKDQKETIDGLYEILEYKDSLINNNYICTEFCD